MFFKLHNLSSWNNCKNLRCCIQWFFHLNWSPVEICILIEVEEACEGDGLKMKCSTRGRYSKLNCCGRCYFCYYLHASYSPCPTWLTYGQYIQLHSFKSLTVSEKLQASVFGFPVILYYFHAQFNSAWESALTLGANYSVSTRTVCTVSHVLNLKPAQDG